MQHQGKVGGETKPNNRFNCFPHKSKLPINPGLYDRAIRAAYDLWELREREALGRDSQQRSSIWRWRDKTKTEQAFYQSSDDSARRLEAWIRRKELLWRREGRIYDDGNGGVLRVAPPREMKLSKVARLFPSAPISSVSAIVSAINDRFALQV